MPLAWGVVYGGRKVSASEKMRLSETYFRAVPQALSAWQRGVHARGDLAVETRRKAGFAGGDVAACRHCGEGPGGKGRGKAAAVGVPGPPRRGGRPSGATGQGMTGQGRARRLGLDQVAPPLMHAFAMGGFLEGAIHGDHEKRPPQRRRLTIDP